MSHPFFPHNLPLVRPLLVGYNPIHPMIIVIILLYDPTRTVSHSTVPLFSSFFIQRAKIASPVEAPRVELESSPGTCSMLQHVNLDAGLESHHVPRSDVRWANATGELLLRLPVVQGEFWSLTNQGK